MSNCGIYYIQNTVTKQIYVGQSKELNVRKRKHLLDLRNNRHYNTYLQNSFNKYGESNFSYGVIEHCEVSELDELEIAYINFYNLKKHGFNICDGGRDVCPDNSNEKHGMWRKDIPNDSLKKMYLGDYNSKQIAKIFNCSYRTINRRLRKIFGEEYDVLKEKKRINGIKKTDKKNPNISDERILKLARNGLNTVEISKAINCSDTTIRHRLKRLLSSEEYESYKRRNINRRSRQRIFKTYEKKIKNHIMEY